MNTMKNFFATAKASHILGLLAGIYLCLACGSDHPVTEDDTGGISGQYLMLQQSGLNTVSVSGNDESYTFPLTVKRVGSNINSQSSAKLEVWSADELATYNNKEKTDYTFLPSSLYTISSPSVVLNSGDAQTSVDIKFDPSQVFAELQQTNARYVIALKLKSEVDKVKDRQGTLLLALSIDFPKVSFASSNSKEVSVNEGTTRVSITTNLTSQLSGESIGSWWDFTCKLNVPQNASELVAGYNKQHNTNYDLLPSDSYNLGEGFAYKAGESQTTGSFTVIQSKLDVKYYLLPLQLAGAGNEHVMYDDAIQYMVVARTYSNPIISDKSVPDPTVIRANDGYFYLYATQTSSYWMPIYRSKDLVKWEYMRTAFTQATKPNLSGGGAFWAPEVQHINGKYVLYYSWAKMNGADVSYTAVAVSDNPLGPFPDSKALITNEEFGSNVIDQYYYEEGGKKYMFFGSFTGIYVTELTDDGLSVKRNESGLPTLKKKICGNAFEGTNIYKKNGYYYLFASIGSCCNGVNSSYKVVVGRSTDLLGPYVDKKGKGMLDNSWELVLEGNMQKWIGPGHNSTIIQDDKGTDWMIYHSYLKTGNEVGGRLGMLDRVQWTDDAWPYIKNCIPSNSDLIPVFNN